MSTFEEFEYAPVGATATGPNGERAVKTHSDSLPWNTARHTRVNDFASLRLFHDGYVLDPLPPSTAREALDLAWELAHPVKNGQVIPAGTEYIRRYDDGTCTHFIAGPATNTVSKWDEHHTRFLDPLPDPTPDWLDAPAVIAAHAYRDDQVLWENCDGIFVNATLGEADWHELRDVTPLWPREEQDA